ncbi:lipopolysaccharide assembly protein LapB, partial [Corallococcus sp. AB030]|uniref:tetratricopeptide repeat protein n=1 Tax=Corallococcus sp. AB030 TaxID=2316716 RepID=UPI0011E58AAE
MGGGRHGKGPRTPEPSLRGPELGSRGEDVRGAVARICRDAARLLQEGQAARAYSGLVSASRSLPMTPRLAAVLVRCALKAGTERAVITLLDAAMVTERGEVRREVRRQLSRVLRRTGQEARAAAVLNGLLMDAPDDARARFVLDVLRERVAKAKSVPSPQLPAEDEESRTKTVEVSALALSDPELGNTVVEMPVVSVPAAPAWAPRAATVQVPLGEWAEQARPASRGPEFPWDDDGPGKARVVTPPRGARTVPEPVVVEQEAGEEAPDTVRPGAAVVGASDIPASAAAASGASSAVDEAPRVESAAGESNASSSGNASDSSASVVAPSSASPSATVPEHVIAALSALMLSGSAKAPERIETAPSSAEAAEHVGGAASSSETQTPLLPDTAAASEVKAVASTTEASSSDAVRTPDEKVEVSTPAAAPPASPVFESTQVFGKKLEEAPPADAALDEKPAPRNPSEETPAAITAAPSKTSAPDASASERMESRSPVAVLVPGAPAMAFDDDEATSEIIPPERAEAEKGASASTQSRDGKPSAPRRASVLVPATSKPAFDEEESTSEVVFPQADSTAQAAPAAPRRDSTRVPSVKPSESPASDAPASARTADEGSERAQSQRQEAQLIARSAWRELAQLYLKRADRAKDAPERAEALTRLAEVMENELQDSAGAARMYREIVELTGERTALREQVRLLSQREDASLVRRALDDAISRARTSRARAVALLTRGERQLNMGNPAKAREDFEAADALVAGMLPVLAGLVRSVSDDERFAQVERLRAACAAAPRRAPDRLEALRVLAKTAEESLGDLRIAQWAWAEVLAESPDNEQPREHLLALARRLGDLPALSALLHAQLAREPRGPAARKAHLERIATLEAMGDAGAALAELRQAVRFEPGHKEAWLLLADRCTEREQFGEAAWALENAATATEEDEERQHTWERLALFCREVLNNTEKARLYARRADSLRKSREQRARPPSPEPTRPASSQAGGVPPPSVLVAPPVATGRVPAAKQRKDLSDEVTSNTDVPSLLQAEEAASANASEKRSAGASGASATSRKGRGNAAAQVGSTNTAGEELEAAPGNKKRGRVGARSDTAERASRKESERGAGASPSASQPGKAPSGSHAPVASAAKAPSGRHASVGDTAQGTEAPRRPVSGKAPVGSPVSLADTVPGAEVDLPPKAPSGRHAPASAASSSTEAPRQPKAPSGRHAPVGTAPVPTEAARQSKVQSGSHAPVGSSAPGADATRQPKAPSGRHAPVGATASSADATRQPKAPSGRHVSVASTPPEAEPPRRAAKAPAESPVSLAESAPAPSGMSRAAKPSRGGSAQEPGPTPDAAASAPDRKPRAATAPPREMTTAFGASLPPDAEPEAPASRKAATAAPTPEDHARSSKNAGTQVREAPSRVERAPRAGHAPRVPLSALSLTHISEPTRRS